MSNHTMKKPIRQRKLSRRQQIEAAQKQWAKNAEELASLKADLGYKDFPWDAFLEIMPDDSFDIATSSQIIDAQARYNDLIQQRKHIWLEDNTIDELNKIHAIVHVGQTYFLKEIVNSFGNKDFCLESRQSFKAYYEDETIICIDGRERCKADLWLKSPKRRKFKGMVFDPRATESLSEYYNLWKGFSREARQGDASRYWNHVRENICSDDKESYQYLRKWQAYIFQYPHIVHTALVLCGSQGVGKNSFVEPLGKLLGPHYAPLSSMSELVSNFNYHLKNAVLIHANEALWGGNKKEIGTIKAMITEECCLIEGKGKDRIIVENFKHIILSSNEDWPVHLDPDDRRFFVLRVSEKNKENHTYFKEIQQELNNGGLEALLYDLLHEDLTDFDPRKLPTNSNAFSIKIRSANSAHRYLYEALCEGGFSIGSEDLAPDWPKTIPKALLYEDYMSWCKKSGENDLSKELFGRVIKKLITSVKDKRPSGGLRQRCYEFTTLRQVQEDFSKAFKENPERIFDNYELLNLSIVQDAVHDI